MNFNFQEFRTDVTPLFAAAHVGHAGITKKLLVRSNTFGPFHLFSFLVLLLSCELSTSKIVASADLCSIPVDGALPSMRPDIALKGTCCDKVAFFSVFSAG